MTTEINKVPATQAAHQRPMPMFGVRVSKDIPEFGFGDLVFKTRLVSVADQLVLTTYQEGLSSKDAEGNELAAAVAEQQIVDSMADIMISLLKPRLVGGDVAQIDREWVQTNMVISDFQPMINLLQTGHMDAEALDEHASSEAQDPNAEQ